MKRCKQIISIISFVLVFFILNGCIGFAVIQEGVTRVAVHELTSENDYKCVILGQSHSSYGINPNVVEEELGLKTMNFSIGGQYMLDMYYYVKKLYETNSPEVVVIDMDYQYFINIPEKDNTIMSTLMYHNYPKSLEKIEYAYAKLQNKEFRAALFPWMNYRCNYPYMKSIISNKFTEEYKECDVRSIKQIDSNDTYKGRGFLYKSRKLIRDDNAKVGIWWNEEKVDHTTSVEYFKKIVEYCRSKGSQVVMITTPINPTTLIGSQDEYSKIEEYMQNLAEDNHLTYYNFNLVKQSAFFRMDSDYWDYDGHMYGNSAEEYSQVLGKFLKKLTSKETINMDDYFYKDVYDMADHYDPDAPKPE